jgi:hypothetical protein
MNEKNYKFNFTKSTYTNALYQGIIQEYIDMYGIDTYYMPKKEYEPEDIDQVFNEVNNKEYDRVYRMRMLLEESIMGGGGDIFSKFGLEIQDEIVLYISIKEFHERRTGEDTDFSKGKNELSKEIELDDFTEYRPEILDLMYVPMWNTFFEVSFVEHQENMVGQFSTSYKLVCKKYIQDENINIDIDETGNGDVDEGAQDDEFNSFVDMINQTDDNNRDRTDIVMDPDETGFDPDNTEIDNDNIEREAESEIRDDNFDPFGML